jgi:hypothetical protein
VECNSHKRSISPGVQAYWLCNCRTPDWTQILTQMTPSIPSPGSTVTPTRGPPAPLLRWRPQILQGMVDAIQSICNYQRFSQSIQRTKETELPNDESTDVSSDVPKQNAKNRNLMAIACLTAAFQDDGLLNMIEQSMISKWPSGLAYVVVDELFKRYRPVDIISRVEMRTIYHRKGN